LLQVADEPRVARVGKDEIRGGGEERMGYKIRDGMGWTRFFNKLLIIF
jgi:hypothetical protein